MASDHVSFDHASQSLTMALEHNSLSPDPQSQANVPLADETVTMSLNVSKSSAVPTADASDKRQQPNTTLSTSTTVAADTTQLDIQTTPEPTTQAPISTAIENINQAEDQAENVMVDEDEFINIFEYHWTKDHPLEQVLGNPSQPVRTRRQLENDGKICMFALIVSHTEPKNIKEAMGDHAWIEAMQEELY
ncbi:hypothetical protein Tco_0200211 [Tanacetum coccineum]